MCMHSSSQTVIVLTWGFSLTLVTKLIKLVRAVWQISAVAECVCRTHLPIIFEGTGNYCDLKRFHFCMFRWHPKKNNSKCVHVYPNSDKCTHMTSAIFFSPLPPPPPPSHLSPWTCYQFKYNVEVFPHQLSLFSPQDTHKMTEGRQEGEEGIERWFIVSYCEPGT